MLEVLSFAACALLLPAALVLLYEDVTEDDF